MHSPVRGLHKAYSWFLNLNPFLCSPDGPSCESKGNSPVRHCGVDRINGPRQLVKHPLFVHSGALPSPFRRDGTFSEAFCLKQLNFFSSLEPDLGLLVLKPFPPSTTLAEITGHNRKQNC